MRSLPILRLGSLFVALIVLLLTLGACSTKRRAQAPSASVRQEKAAILTALERQAGSWQGLRASLQMQLSLGQRSVSSRVSVHCIRGKGIRMSAMPFPLIEAARAWFTEEEVILVDLIGRRYAQESYETLSSMLGLKITYEQIEALLLGRVFSPEGTGTSPLRRLTFKPLAPSGAELSYRARGGYEYAFVLDEGALLHTSSLLRSGSELLRVEYSRHNTLDEIGSMLPGEAIYSFMGHTPTAAPRARVEVQWSRTTIVEPEELNIQPNVRSGYSRIGIDKIIELIKRFS